MPTAADMYKENIAFLAGLFTETNQYQLEFSTTTGRFSVYRGNGFARSVSNFFSSSKQSILNDGLFQTPLLAVYTAYAAKKTSVDNNVVLKSIAAVEKLDYYYDHKNQQRIQKLAHVVREIKRICGLPQDQRLSPQRGPYQPGQLTLTNAEEAQQIIVNAYRDHLPVWNRRQKPAAEIYRICGPDEFSLEFSKTYRNLFRKANAVLIPGMIDAMDISGFVTPDLDPRNREIIINAGIAKFGTLVHEYVHYISHGAFYPNFYSIGGYAPFVVEGVTEYLTRASAPGDIRLSTRQNYQSNFLETRSWLNNNQARKDAMINWIFKGETNDLTESLAGIQP